MIPTSLVVSFEKRTNTKKKTKKKHGTRKKEISFRRNYVELRLRITHSRLLLSPLVLSLSLDSRARDAQRYFSSVPEKWLPENLPLPRLKMFIPLLCTHDLRSICLTFSHFLSCPLSLSFSFNLSRTHTSTLSLSLFPFFLPLPLYLPIYRLCCTFFRQHSNALRFTLCTSFFFFLLLLFFFSLSFPLSLSIFPSWRARGERERDALLD